jgi:pSer/pThr/pTyr-binding forkhead associated (FHA) protein
MPKMIVSIDGVVIKEIQISKDRITMGRRPYNDIVIDNLAVSGEHAAVLTQGNEVYLEDLGSTNGTYISGKAVKRQLLQNGDTVEIGKYKIKFLHERGSMDNAVVAKAGGIMPQDMDSASIKIISGPAMGRTVELLKVVTTIGKPGVAVAAITKRPNGYVIALIEGESKPTVNGTAVQLDPVPLKHGDVLELAGTKMEFVQI